MSARILLATATGLLALGLPSCTDDGIVGTRAAQSAGACEPSCQGGALCHPELEVCVACLEDTDCPGEPGTVTCDPATNECAPCVDDDPEPFDDDDDCDLDERDGSSPDDDDDDPSP